MGEITTTVNDKRWRYRETAYSAEIIAGSLTLKAHWTGSLKPEVIKETMKQVIDDHRLAALVPQLVQALRGLKQQHGCWCELPPNVGSPDHTIQCEVARAAIKAIDDSQEGMR